MSEIIINNGVESEVASRPTDIVVFVGKNGENGKDGNTPDMADYPKFSELGSIAFENLIEKAKLGSTIVEGAYIKTELIDAVGIRLAGGGITSEDASEQITEMLSEVTLESLGAGDLAYYNAVKKAMEDETIIIGGFIDTELINTSAIIIGKDNLDSTLIVGNKILTSLINAEELVIGKNNLDSTIISGNKIRTDILNVNEIVVNGGGITEGNVDSKISTALATVGLESLGAGDLAYLNIVEWAKLGTTIIDGGYFKNNLIDTNGLIVRDGSGNNIGTLITGTKVQTQFLNVEEIVVNGGGATTSQLQALTFGGRNYIPNSKFDLGLTGWNIQYGTESMSLVSGKLRVTRSLTGYGVIGVRQVNVPALEAGTYTISLKATSSTTKMIGVNFDPNGFVLLTNFTGTQIHSSTFTIGSGMSNFDLRIIGYSDFSQGEYFDIDWVKIEKGDRATDWQPAPSDGINYTQNQANSIINSLGNMASWDDIPEDYIQESQLGSTIIDGGHLVANLVDSDVVRSAVVTASWVNALKLTAQNFSTSNNPAGRRIEIIGAQNALRFYNSNGGLAIELSETDGEVAFNVFDTDGNLIYKLGQEGARTVTVGTPYRRNYFAYRNTEIAIKSKLETGIDYDAGTGWESGDFIYNPADSKFYTDFSLASFVSDGYYIIPYGGGDRWSSLLSGTYVVFVKIVSGVQTESWGYNIDTGVYILE